MENRQPKSTERKMNLTRNQIIRIAALGLITLIIFTTCCFYLRLICDENLHRAMSGRIKVEISPSRLFPDLDTHPETTTQSNVSFSVVTAGQLMAQLGAFRQLDAVPAPDRRRQSSESIMGTISPDVFYYRAKSSSAWYMIYFDSHQHLFVHCDLLRHVENDRPRWTRQIIAYAGPNGIAPTPDESLGRFGANLLRSPDYWHTSVIFDCEERRFYKIDFLEKRFVTKGPQIPPESAYKPVRIGSREQSQRTGYLNCSPPYQQDPCNSRRDIPLIDGGHYARDALFVIDSSGRIDKLDPQTMTLGEQVGQIPLFGINGQRLDQQSIYRFRPIIADNTYRGLVTASLSRDLTHAALYVFDPNGNFRASTTESLSWRKFPGGPALTICRYLIEQLHPPLLSFISPFIAPYTDAGSGYRALFVLAKSTVGRTLLFLPSAPLDHANLLDLIKILGQTLILVLPALLFAIILSRRVVKDAQARGLSRRTRKVWSLLTIAFGLTAYITYRLTRPTETLVTCQNCGKLRRPDHHLCHHCQSKWRIPELTPPVWRIVE